MSCNKSDMIHAEMVFLRSWWLITSPHENDCVIMKSDMSPTSYVFLDEVLTSFSNIKIRATVLSS